MAEQAVCTACGETLHPGVAFCTACGADARQAVVKGPRGAPASSHAGIPQPAPPPLPDQAVPSGHEPLPGFQSRRFGPHPRMVYQGFWIRLAAGVLDLVILCSAGFALMGLAVALTGPEALDLAEAGGPRGTRSLFTAFTPLGWSSYEWIAFLVSPLGTAWLVATFGGTPGKLICGIRIVDEYTHRHLTYGRACGRAYAKSLLYGLVGCVGVPLVIVSAVGLGQDRRKQSLHDRMVKSLCVRRNLPVSTAYEQPLPGPPAPPQAPAGAPPAY